MKQYWEQLAAKIDSMSLRERALIFAAIAFMLVALAKTLFMEPLLVQQKKLSSNISQQQEKMKALQAQIDASLQARKALENSSQHHRLEQVRQQLAEGRTYLQNRRDRLVAPEEIAQLLQQILDGNGRLQLVNLKTLPVAPLVIKSLAKPKKVPVNPAVDGGVPAEDDEALDKQVFKHGVVITVHGSYLDLLQYLDEIEKSPMQMFWGKAEMNVVRYPEVELSLTVYTLSMEKTWLQI